MSNTMKRPVQSSRPFTAAEIDDCLLEFNSAMTIPPRCYNDPLIFEMEKERILKSSWFYVGHISEVGKPGDYFTVDICEEPILVIRDRDNELHALSNVCVHRNFPVAHDRGNCNLLKCKYHNWIYNPDGSLRGAPLMEKANNFSAKEWRMHEFHLEIWQGFIFVNMERGPVPALAPQHESIAPKFERHQTEDMVYFQLGEYELDVNWKCVVDIFAENYHTDGIHVESLGDSVPSKNTVVDRTDMDAYSLFRIPSGAGSDINNPDDYCLAGGFAIPDTLNDEDRGSAVGGITFPSFSWYFNPDLLFLIEMNPQTVNRTSGRWGMGVSKEATEAPDFEEKLEAYKKNSQLVVDEDVWAILEMERGKRSSFAVQGRTSFAEGSLWHFHKWYLQSLQEKAPELF